MKPYSVVTSQNYLYSPRFMSLVFIVQGHRDSITEVVDESDGCGGKFSALIVSEKFQGKPLLARHRLVNSVLQEELKSIHAFTQKTLTVDQWNLQNQVSAPGKVILHGEHSVMYGETAIAYSLGLRTTIHLEEFKTINKPVINIRLPSVGLHETFCLSTIVNYLFDPTDSKCWKHSLKIDHDSHLEKVDKFVHKIKTNFDDLLNIQKNSMRGFLYLFSKILGHTTLLKNSLDIEITSELNVGAGTGSSASFAVCVVGALLHLLKMKCGRKDTEFSYEDKEQISAEAFNCEKIMHGRPSGIDNTTCTFGSQVSFKKGELPHLLNLKINLHVLLVNTKVSRETNKLLIKVTSLKNKNKQAFDCVIRACGHIANTAIQILKELSQDDTQNSEEKYQDLADIWNMNHCLLASLGVSHPMLEDIRASAGARGLACKLTGAGGGGHAIVLVPPSTKQSTVEDLMTELEKKGYNVKDIQLGGAGVTLDENSLE